MVRLNCASTWERLLIPAFVFFFQKLYPFAWVNDPARATAAAAGGCLLVRRSALEHAGGIAAIRDRIIDDCALAALVKRGGAIWLGLAERSPLLLAGTMLGMVLIYLAPPVALVLGAVTGRPETAVLGALGWIAMAAAYRPTLRLYGEPWWRGLALPLAALPYTAMTVGSARRHWFGAGATWKGRSYAKSALR